MSADTVISYIDLLECFSRNVRNEISKKYMENRLTFVTE